MGSAGSDQIGEEDMTESGVINQQALDELLEAVGGDQEFLADLIDTFLEDAPGLLSTIQSALASGEAEELRRAAHSLKSNSANFGAQQLAAMCRDLEEAARRSELEEAPGRVAQILVEYQKVSQALSDVK
jgi:HPt (histidine-containing phosphotransfer) domain-containing protein